MDHANAESGAHATSKSRLIALTIAAVGVVFGDIGTSPLYALKECFSPHYGLPHGELEIKGILSLIFWSLTLIIGIKYLAIIMRFGNNGEGGILALMELVAKFKSKLIKRTAIIVMGLFGSALLYGDGVITPAISVLSAIEGLTVAAPSNDLGYKTVAPTANQLSAYGYSYGVLIDSIDPQGKMAENEMHKGMLIVKVNGKEVFAPDSLTRIITSSRGDDLTFTVIGRSGAEETITIDTPNSNPLVVPITLVILFGLFFIQKYGTARVGRIFGPFMLGWFGLLAVLGIISIMQTPDILWAINPYYALTFFVHHGFLAFAVLGSVFLVVTGGEALYADMGHFGRTPIMRGWFYIAYPALLLQYFGQGALLIRDSSNPATLSNPFFHMVPSWGVLPLVIISTGATIIASQAVISGAFSLTWQALQLGYLPRLKVTHTSSEERGQIYIPTINWLLFIFCVILVVTFSSSGALAAAYGIAVTSTMVITTILAWSAMRNILGWSQLTATVISIIFLVMDVAFVTANGLKFLHGGYVPIVLACGIFMVMVTWHTGRRLLQQAIDKTSKPLADVINEPNRWHEHVAGTAIYMTQSTGNAPRALVSNLTYNRVRHECLIFLSVEITANARERGVGDPRKRYDVRVLDGHDDIYVVNVRYGFMDQLDIMTDLKFLPELEVMVDVTDAIFVLGQETITVRDGKSMAKWRKEIFIFLHRNSRKPASYFGIPTKRVLELGANIAI